MIPRSLSLRNFLSYGEQVPPLDFTEFGVACLTGGNGHGKSALLDAVTYALWGQARKGQTDRKADEGLCRIGANEMRVEFDFLLDGVHYRVIRTWRRTKRGNPGLELQIANDGNYRTLSEGAGINRTQEQINQLLALDYETFINSAFIVQGRADEFTQKNARQRKEVLGQILGLGHYDRLQGMARLRYQEYLQQSKNHQVRLEELNAELAGRESHEAELQIVNDRLVELNEEIAQLEKEQALLDEKRLEQAQVHQRFEELKREKERISTRAQQVSKELEYGLEQQQKDGQILSDSATIERDFETHNQLRIQVAKLDQKAVQYNHLEGQRSDLQTQIDRARQDVERRQERWAAIYLERQHQLDEYRTLLDQEQTISARYALFKSSSEQQQALEQLRSRHESLLHERSKLEHTISLEQQARQAQRQTLAQSLEKLCRITADLETLSIRNREVQARLTSLETKAVERDRLKEEGSKVNTQLAEQRQQLLAEEEELEKERQQTKTLTDSAATLCPLCGSELDSAHRQEVDLKLRQREDERSQSIAILERSIANLEDQLQKMRALYQPIEEETASIHKLTQELATATARYTHLQQSAIEAQELRSRIAEIDTELEQRSYALNEYQRLEQLESEITKLGYSNADHNALREKLAELGSVETEFIRLKDAKNQSTRLVSEQAEAREKRDLATTYLTEHRYAQEERAKEQDLEKQITELGYADTERQQSRQRLDDLLESVTRFERLQNARGRRDSISTTLTRCREESNELEQELQRTEELAQQSSGRLRELDDIAKHQEANQNLLARNRSERDNLLQRQGALSTECSRYAKLAEERDKVREELKNDQRETWFYQRLDEAFGKDGIPSLIIENAVPQIEKETNAILSRLTDNRIQIAFDLLRDLKKGGTRETLDIKIADEIGERSYHLYSGGEAFRTNFALRIALSKVLAMRSGTQLRTLFIDEGFGTQDERGLEYLIEAIQAISHDFDKVIVVTHIEELKAVFPVQIQVTKHPDFGSCFEVIHHR